MSRFNFTQKFQLNRCNSSNFLKQICVEFFLKISIWACSTQFSFEKFGLSRLNLTFSNGPKLLENRHRLFFQVWVEPAQPTFPNFVFSLDWTGLAQLKKMRKKIGLWWTFRIDSGWMRVERGVKLAARPGKIKRQSSSFASCNPARVLSTGLSREDHVWITTDHFVRVHLLPPSFIAVARGPTSVWLHKST